MGRKGYELGVGTPLICVSVMETESSQIIERAKQLIEKGVDAIEWRVDYFSEKDNPQACLDVAKALGQVTERTLLIATLRTSSEGGMGSPEENYYRRLLLTMAEAGTIDYMDMEIGRFFKPGDVIEELHDMDTLVLASYHDFKNTPETGYIYSKAQKMYDSGADIAKIAVMPSDIEDVAKLLLATTEIKAGYPDRPLITISMGQEGKISRLVGERFGSCLTFAAEGQASAPGQVSIEEAREMLALMHERL